MVFFSVMVNQILQNSEFVWISGVEILLVIFLDDIPASVLLHKHIRHFDPDFNALDSRQIPLLCQLNPTLFIQLRPHIKLQIL